MTRGSRSRGSAFSDAYSDGCADSSSDAEGSSVGLLLVDEPAGGAGEESASGSPDALHALSTSTREASATRDRMATVWPSA